MANFPVKPQLSQGESPSKYGIKQEVNEIKSETEGGYEFKRKRFTRAERNILDTGFIGIKHVDKLILDAFYNTHGTTLAFNYYDYIAGLTRQVRFEESPKWDYVGIGQTKLWNVTFKMKEI